MANDLTLFAQRLLKFDPAALIRLRASQAWGQLPWGVLVTIDLPSAVEGDRVVTAADATPSDAKWRGTLPPAASSTVETLPAALVLNAAKAAAETLRELTGRAGERAIRDALLDHEVITGESDVDGTPFVVSQRLVQAMVRMGFVGSAEVEIRRAGPWTGLVTPAGQAWLRSASQLTVRPIVNHLNGR
ncbi:MAG TPA: hypothetical protein DGG94_22040 [Micromonosporaceae bacterium]|nr:hypothetical protein [Micromonosporaceae bacterium]HCU52440.1 hypothetical protein [Micromonosporaceae bacterium]